MEGKAALWTLVGIFVVFKLVTTAVILMMDPDAAQLVISLFVAFHWPFVVFGVMMGLGAAGGWLAFRRRLLRVRARKRELEEAEWRPEEIPQVFREWS